MLKKKFFAKALAFAMVAGTIGTTSISMQSPAIVFATGEPTLKMDYNKFEATITVTGTEPYVCLQVLKDAEGSKVSAEHWYPVNSEKKAIIDLSFLSASKVQYLRPYSPTAGAGEVTTTKAQPKKISVKYDAKKQEFQDGKTKLAITDLTKYEYKTLYSAYWGKVSGSEIAPVTLDGFTANDKALLKNAVIAGTTLVIRQPSVKEGDGETLASAEVKVKIPALAKAPKVKVDYNKGTIQLPKGAEIAVLGTAALTDDDFTSLTGNLSQDALLEKLGKDATASATLIKAGYTLVVRTEETDKKAASKLAMIQINKGYKLSDPSSNVITINSVSTDKITCTPEATGLKVKFEGAEASAPATIAYSTDGKKWTTVARGTEVTVALEDKASIQIRVPAVKENKLTNTEGQFASNTVEVKYTKPAL